MVSYVSERLLMELVLTCLNPYCSGRWSRTNEFDSNAQDIDGLNPYCSGRWSRTLLTDDIATFDAKGS